MKISIIGAGNGGQAMAGHFSILGHSVCLYNRNKNILEIINQNGGINVSGKVNGFGKIDCITNSLKEVCEYSNLIMITTTADAHKYIANDICKYITTNHKIVLNPGRTFGALEFSQVLKSKGKYNISISETQSLIYACRSNFNGDVKIIGIKSNVFLSSIPAVQSNGICDILNEIYNCFVPAKNILQTSLENIGAILHPSVVLFNSATIERGDQFAFYNDMTEAVANFIIDIDKERIALGKIFDIDLHSVEEWVSFSYDNIKGNTFHEKIKNNPAYYKIMSPQSINTRYITEDLPTGILPYLELGRLVSFKMPLMDSVYKILSNISGIDFIKTGRTFKNLMLENISKTELLELIK